MGLKYFLCLSRVLNLSQRQCTNSSTSQRSSFLTTPEKYLKMANGSREISTSSPNIELNAISTWPDYYRENKTRIKEQLAEMKVKPEANNFVVNSELNNKVSIWKGDITKLKIDAIVNAANNSLLGGGGVDGAIHRAGGPALLDECRTLNGCKTGDAKITGGYNLPAKHVIHTVGPKGEIPDRLESCYSKCLQIALSKEVRSIAFPCISTGVYGYPPESAAHIALNVVRTVLEKNPSSFERIIFCLFLPTDVKIYESLLQIYFPIE